MPLGVYYFHFVLLTIKEQFYGLQNYSISERRIE